MQQMFCLCYGERILTKPKIYDRNSLARAIAHHGLAEGLLPFAVPTSYLDIGHLRLLPVFDETVIPSPDDFYHVGQAKLEVSDYQVIRSYPVNPYSIEYCAELVAKEVSDKVDAVKPKLSVGYPDIEVDSWPLQLMEANAYATDPETSVPTLKGIAARRGLELSDLVDRVLAKAPVYSEKIGFLLGSRQFVEDELTKLKESEPENWLSQLVELRSTWQSDWPPELLGK
ncbi:hypothetical protein [Marinomonas atlantica]|uniref:hypothetical protein n=1 Tax=Marinomonas atlantica TaxID=1806668 RepID=UPI0008361174|nr:hypothetical protein [Marinomonas atlantica]